MVDTIPLEWNLTHLNGVRFDKGCYIGQELVARTQFKVGLRMNYWRRNRTPAVWVTHDVDVCHGCCSQGTLRKRVFTLLPTSPFDPSSPPVAAGTPIVRATSDSSATAASGEGSDLQVGTVFAHHPGVVASLHVHTHYRLTGGAVVMMGGYDGWLRFDRLRRTRLRLP